MFRKCFLKSRTNSGTNLQTKIELPHQTEIVVGRSKFTCIKDPSCSRQQLSFRADCEKCVVEVKHLGINPSGLNGFSMVPSIAYEISHGGKIELLLNQYEHYIEFEPPPETNDGGGESPQRKKKKESNEVEDNTKDKWESIDNGQLLIYTTKLVEPREKIAAYDLDGTLIKTKSGKVHPNNCDDWQLFLPTIPQKFNELINKGYQIVLFTNQAPLGNGKVKVEEFKLKVESVVRKFSVPTTVFIATNKGIYRKPLLGMWNHLVDKKNVSLSINLKKSYYCGDAAGRLASWAPGRKKDHSLADRFFAENIGLQFFTPEEHFLSYPLNRTPICKPSFDPKILPRSAFNYDELIKHDTEILVLVGYPGSGKSHFAKKIVTKSNGKYERICRDELNSWQKCVLEAKQVIQNGKSPIIDSTNPDKESRQRWIELAREVKIGCRCVRMAVPISHARHNNKFRELTDKKHGTITDIVFYGYRSRYIEPTVEEGFSEVRAVKITPEFHREDHEKLYFMYLLEK